MQATRDGTMTPGQKRFMRIPPWIVTGRCECGQHVEVRVYGLRAELEHSTCWPQMKLKCKDCKP